MAASAEFTSRRKGDAFGLTIFGNEVLRWTPLTKDLSAHPPCHAVPAARDLPQHFGGTEIGKALAFLLRTMPERGEGDRMVVLLSDGRAPTWALARGRSAPSWPTSGSCCTPIHIGDGRRPAICTICCRPTGGHVFAAATPEAWPTVFDHIDHMQPAKLKPGPPQQVDYLPAVRPGRADRVGFVSIGPVRPEVHAMVIWWITAAVVAAVCLSEWLHARRCRRLAYLGVRPGGQAAGVGGVGAPLRVLAAAPCAGA